MNKGRNKNSSLQDPSEYTHIIRPKRHLFEVNLKEVWRYRDLLKMFVKRDVVTVYKQTVLGPVWYIIQPILTSAIYVLVFGRIAKISTDGMPQILFYLSGIVIWNYFAESFNTTSRTFYDNAGIFGKVYFPRLILPLSKISSGLIKFLIQFLLLVIIYIYFLAGDYTIEPNITLLLLPVYILIMAFFGLGFGILFTSLTVRYRDLNFLLAFGVQLLMYATPVIYPISAIPEKYKILIIANPLSHIVEGFKYALLGVGEFSWFGLGYSFVITVIVVVLGLLVFNRTEKNFIDTV